MSRDSHASNLKKILDEHVCVEVGVLFVLPQEAANTRLLNQCSQGQRRLSLVEVSRELSEVFCAISLIYKL